MFLYILKIFCLLLYFFTNDVLCIFEMCNHKFTMKTGEKMYINSPYYPADYPIGTSCRYVIKSPPDHKLKFTCNINLKNPLAVPNTCPNEVIHFNREGNEILTESEYFCGTGKMIRKSFLNQAVLSYISMPDYKRVVENVLRHGYENNENNNTIRMKTIIKKQQQKLTKTTRRTTATKKTSNTFKTLKVNHLKTLTATTTPKVVFKDSLTSFFMRQPLSSTTLVPTFSHKNIDEEKKVFNSTFAYVDNLLSTKMRKENLLTITTTTATTTTTQSPTITSLKTITSRPTSVLNMCHNSSYKFSTKRVDHDCISPQPLKLKSTSSTQNPINHLKENIQSSKGTGTFSCLVEVIRPQCECGWSSIVKIAGATGVAGINEFPSMAGIMTIKNQKIFCGASIIHHRYLLSAAHCFITFETNAPEYLTAVVGEQDLSMVLDSFYTRHYEIIKIILHEKFKATSTKVQNDIAILKTRIPIEWNRNVAPACLPFDTLKQIRDTVPYAGQSVETAGWGTTSFGGQQTTELLKTTLDVLSHTECRNILGNLPSKTFCTFTLGRDTCQYDSGGALYDRRDRLFAVGIVSYGYACATNRPSVNTRVSSYLKWLRNKTPEAEYCVK